MANSGGNWITYKGRRIYIGGKKSGSSAGKGTSKENKKGVKSLSGELEKDNKGRVVSQEEYDAFRQAYKDGKISQKDYRNDNYDALKNTKKESKADYELYKKAKENPDSIDPMTENSTDWEGLDKKYGEKYKNEKSKSLNNEEAKTYMQDQFKAFDKGDISSADLEKAKKDSGLSKEEIDNARKYVNDRAPKSYEKATENKSGNTTIQAVPNKESSNNLDDKFNYGGYYKRERLGEPGNYQTGDKVFVNDGYYGEVKGTILREATTKEKLGNMNTNLKGYVVKDERGYQYVVPDTRIAEAPDWIRNAYKKYKEEHPGTRMKEWEIINRLKKNK